MYRATFHGEDFFLAENEEMIPLKMKYSDVRDRNTHLSEIIKMLIRALLD